MNKPLPPEIQRRLHALYRYVKAMETGDLESIAALLRSAEQDAILDRMFQEIDIHYQTQDQMTVQPNELAEVEQRLTDLSMQELERVQTQSNGQNSRPANTPPVFPLLQERRPIAMPYQPISSISEQETRDIPRIQPAPQKRHGRRISRFAQMLAAVLLVAALVGGFLALFTRLATHQPGSGVAVQSTPQAQPPGIFVAVSSTTGTAHPSGTVEAYGLRAANNIPIWSTFLTQSAAEPGPIVTHDQIAYIPIANSVFALQAHTGKILWKITLPTDPSSSATLKVEGDILLASGQDKQVVTSLYRLNEQDGSILWHYQTGSSTAFAVSNGVVYTGKDEVTSMFTPNPGSQRFLLALNATNGEVLWSRDNILTLSISIQNNTLYVQSMPADNTGSDKRYFLSAWTTGGHESWSIMSPTNGTAVIAFDGGLLLLSTGNNLCAYQTNSGHQAWCTHNPTQTFKQDGATLTEGFNYTGYIAQNGVLYAAYNVQTALTSTHHSSASFLQALNIQTGALIWSQKVGTLDIDITTRGSGTIINASRIVGLNVSSDNTFMSGQTTLSIAASNSIFTFSLTNGHLLWQSTIKPTKDSVGFVEVAYVAP